MKTKIIALILTLAALLSLASCGSAFDKPEKYVTMPPLSEITVSSQDIEKELETVVKDLLDNMTGEHFTPLVSPSETVRAGDRVHISLSPDSSAGLSEETRKLLTSEKNDRLYVIPKSGTMPAALEDILVGAKVGDTLSAHVSYTEDDTDIKELIGKTVALNVTVHEIGRVTVRADHAVKVKFTAKLSDGTEPVDTILKLLQGGIETVDLADTDDTFNEVFSATALREYVVGLHKLDETDFTLSMPSDVAAGYGYDRDVSIDFHLTVMSVSETPTELTDRLVDEMTYGVYTSVDSYMTFCRNMVKEELALQAIMKAATFAEEMPQKEYDEFYTENYNSALYSVVGDVSGYTPEELTAMLSQDVLDRVEDTAHQNTVNELCERFALEYLYELLDVSLTSDEYKEKLDELFDSYYEEYYYMLYYYNITTPEALEAYLGKEYLEVQFLYEKLLPMLKDVITYTE